MLVPQLVGRVQRRRHGPRARVEDDLGHAVAVAEVDEDQAPVVAAGVDPAVEDHLLADVVFGQLAAGLRPFEHGRRWVESPRGVVDAGPFGDRADAWRSTLPLLIPEGVKRLSGVRARVRHCELPNRCGSLG